MKNCPDCGGEMWDNRPKKKSGEFTASAPDFKCKDKDGCGKGIWPKKRKADDEPPGNEWDDELLEDDEVVEYEERRKDDVTEQMLEIFDRCLDHVRMKAPHVSWDVCLGEARNMAVSVFITKTQNGR